MSDRPACPYGDSTCSCSAHALFRWGSFVAASGKTLDWKIECDVLTPEDWRALAHIVAPTLPPISDIVPVPTGGVPFADALREAGVGGNPEGQRLIVDDVWTTGGSVRKFWRAPDIAVVAFARGATPWWVSVIWRLGHDYAA
jgi:hypothetical protein